MSFPDSLESVNSLSIALPVINISKTRKKLHRTKSLLLLGDLT